MRPHVRRALEGLLWDLDNVRLTVELFPSARPEEAARGAKVRTVTQENPGWYRDLCARHASSRTRRTTKPDTRIRRRNVRRTIATLLKRGASRSRYAREIIQVACAVLREERGGATPWRR